MPPLEMARGARTGAEERSRGRSRIWRSTLWLAWLGFWFWAFSFAYSDSFFQYDRCSRLSVLGAALLGAAVAPASARLAWRRRSVLAALATHAAGIVAALLPLVLVSNALTRVSGACHLEADDAMGAGIDLLLLSGVGVASLLLLLVACGVRIARRGRDAAR